MQRWVGFLFLGLLAAYLYANTVWASQSTRDEPEAPVQPLDLMNPARCWTMVVGGLFLVVVGARVLVPAASEIAVRVGVPDDVIAATLVAFGTSLPELMTAIASVRKGHPEIMVGNIVGADVLNVLFVIGAAAATAPLAIPANFYYFHFPAMLIILISFRIFIRVYGVYVILQYSLNIQPAH